MNNKKSFYAIIPATVRYCENLPANAKLLYGEITALCHEQGFCWANNHYFAELYNVRKEAISRWISNLETEGFIHTEIDVQKGNSRKIFLKDAYSQKTQEVLRKKSRPSCEKTQDPHAKKVKHNITINNTVNNTDISLKEILSKIKTDYPVVYESILEGQLFHERLQVTLKSDNLPSDLQKDISPVLFHWIKNKWTANDLDKPASRLRTEATSYVIQVIKNGGLKTGSKEEEKVILQKPKNFL